MADITYDLIKDTASFNHIPILTLDKRWYLLVPEVSKTDEIKYWEKKVNDLLKKQGQVTNDLKEVKKIKEQVIQDVVENMEEDGNDFRRKKRMNKNQRLIHEPRQLAEANRKLLVETVKMCYAKINENKADLEVLDKWIEATRIKLKKNLLIKHDKESMNEQLYSGMHNIFGPEIMGVLDDINSKGQE